MTTFRLLEFYDQPKPVPAGVRGIPDPNVRVYRWRFSARSGERLITPGESFTEPRGAVENVCDALALHLRSDVRIHDPRWRRRVAVHLARLDDLGEAERILVFERRLAGEELPE